MAKAEVYGYGTLQVNHTHTHTTLLNPGGGIIYLLLFIIIYSGKSFTSTFLRRVAPLQTFPTVTATLCVIVCYVPRHQCSLNPSSFITCFSLTTHSNYRFYFTSRFHPQCKANNGVLKMLLSRGYPFTVCNILCAGNMVGVITLFPFYSTHLTWKNIRKISKLQWIFMLLGCLLANVLGPLFYLQGLTLTR